MAKWWIPAISPSNILVLNRRAREFAPATSLHITSFEQHSTKVYIYLSLRCSICRCWYISISASLLDYTCITDKWVQWKALYKFLQSRPLIISVITKMLCYFIVDIVYVFFLYFPVFAIANVSAMMGWQSQYWVLYKHEWFTTLCSVARYLSWCNYINIIPSPYCRSLIALFHTFLNILYCSIW